MNKFSINPNVAGVLAILVGALDAVAKGQIVLPDYIPAEYVHIIVETDKSIVTWWNLLIVPMLCFLSSSSPGIFAKVPENEQK